MTYAIECLGCGQVFRFRSMERIGLRVRKHRCEDATNAAEAGLEARQGRAGAAPMRKKAV